MRDLVLQIRVAEVYILRIGEVGQRDLLRDERRTRAEVIPEREFTRAWLPFCLGREGGQRLSAREVLCRKTAFLEIVGLVLVFER